MCGRHMMIVAIIGRWLLFMLYRRIGALINSLYGFGFTGGGRRRLLLMALGWLLLLNFNTFGGIRYGEKLYIQMGANFQANLRERKSWLVRTGDFQTNIYCFNLLVNNISLDLEYPISRWTIATRFPAPHNWNID